MRPSSEGILVLGRYTPDGEHPLGVRPPEKPPSVGLTHTEILTRYRGIDGVTWPDVELADFVIEECLVDAGRKNQVFSYFEFISSFYRADMLYCQLYSEVPSLVSLPSDLIFLGYDYGYLLPDYQGGCGRFSVLLNEVVYGTHKRLRSYGRFLNNNLLAPSLDLLQKLHAERCQLLESGEGDLETAFLDEPAQTVVVFDFQET